MPRYESLIIRIFATTQGAGNTAKRSHSEVRSDTAAMANPVAVYTTMDLSAATVRSAVSLGLVKRAFFP